MTSNSVQIQHFIRIAKEITQLEAELASKIAEINETIKPMQDELDNLVWNELTDHDLDEIRATLGEEYVFF